MVVVVVVVVVVVEVVEVPVVVVAPATVVVSPATVVVVAEATVLVSVPDVRAQPETRDKETRRTDRERMKIMEEDSLVVFYPRLSETGVFLFGVIHLATADNKFIQKKLSRGRERVWTF